MIVASAIVKPRSLDNAMNFAPISITLSVLFSLLITNQIYSPMESFAAAPSNIPIKSWHELSNPKNLLPINGAYYYEFSLPNGSTAHLVVANIKNGKWRLVPVLLEKTSTTSHTASSSAASAAVNGGYFNLNDGESASYVIKEGKLVADPHNNKALTGNPKLQAFLPQIFERSELRILKSKSKKDGKPNQLQIARHSDALPKDTVLVDSMQAGPRLLPQITLEEEGFLRKQNDGTYVDAIGGKKAAARTAIGITNDGHALILAVAGKGQDPESTGLTLADMADLLKRLGCTEALNLDGGSSTSMFVRTPTVDSGKGATVCAKSPETLVKTVLLLMPQ